jgi:hypothetical protein
VFFEFGSFQVSIQMASAKSVASASPRLILSDLALEHACACLRSRGSSRLGLRSWTGSLQAWRISYRLSFVSLGSTRTAAQCIAIALPCHVGCCLGACLRLGILSTSTASPQKTFPWKLCCKSRLEDFRHVLDRLKVSRIGLPFCARGHTSSRHSIHVSSKRTITEEIDTF